MADDIVISEVLCFIRNNFDKLTLSDLIPALIDFYDDDELSHAKEVLLKIVTKVLDESGRVSELPRIPRRVGDKKNKLVVDDLLKLFTIADEQKLSLPSFVAYDLSRVPFLNADSFNMVSMVRKMETFERRLNAMENCFIRDVVTAPSEQLKTAEVPVDINVNSGDNSNNTTSATSQSVQFGFPHDDDVHSDTDTDHVTWTAVTRRYRPPQPRRSTAQSTDGQRRKENVQRKNSKMFGTSHDDNNVIKSGVEIVHKAVVHIDNLDANCSTELLKDYLLSQYINVISCYVSKSWLRDDEKENVTAFRVCVSADHRNKLMDGSIWSKGIILRDWKFKGKPVPQRNGSPTHGEH